MTTALMTIVTATWTIGPLVVLQPVWLIFALAMFLLAVRWRQHTANDNWQAVMSPAVFEFLAGKAARKPGLNYPLLIAGIVAICLSQPVLRHANDDTWRHSVGWIAVVDVSRSMTLTDITPSRLSAARRALAILSEQSGARPIALIIYSGDAFLIAPPAFDKSIFNEHAALLEHGIIETEGSNLTRALSLTASVIADSGFAVSRVFVLTDTGGISDNAIAAASYLADNGHSLDVLVFGSSDAAAQLSPTSIDPNLATDLSAAGGGKTLFANVLGVVDYEPLTLDSRTGASDHAELKTLVWKDQSHWLLLLAIPLLLLQFRQENH